MDDKALGYIILIGSLLGIGLYFYLMFISPWSLLVVQVSAFLAVAAMLTVVAWIGYTFVTTPSPLSLEEFEEFEGLEEENA